MLGSLERMRARYRALQPYLEKIRKDNIHFLTCAVAWNVLLSAVPMAIGIIALSRVVFQHGQQRVIATKLSQAFQDVLGPRYLEHVVNLTVQHSALLWIGAVLAALWGAWNVGFALSAAFDAMFEVRSRSFLEDKLIDLAMFFVLLLLALVIVSVTAVRDAAARTVAYSSPFAHALIGPGTAIISVLCAFVLFAVIYTVYPNTTTRLRMDNVWKGALLAAVLFQGLTYIWPLYEAHFRRYGGFLFPLLALTLWVYLFSAILLIGAEVVAVEAIREARDTDQEIGEPPDDTVPQHRTAALGRPTRRAG